MSIAFMEAVIKPMTMADRSEQFQAIFSMFRGEQGWETIVGQNFFVEKVLPGSVVRGLTEEAMNIYRAPFLEESTRKPIYVFPNDIPLDGEPADVVAAVEAYGAALANAKIPMLLLSFEPGAIIGTSEVDWCRSNFPTLTVKAMGKGNHFVQEDQPEAIGKAIAGWLAGLG